MSRIWVADTCALLQVRRCVVPEERRRTVAERRRAFEELGARVEDGRLVFPPETCQELKDGSKKIKTGPDLPYDFVQKHQKRGKRPARFETVKRIVADPLLRRVVDPSAEKEEADVYVLGLALDIRDGGNEVGVLTQERRDLPRKLSMTTACGILELVCLPMEGYLHQEGIWDWRFGD